MQTYFALPNTTPYLLGIALILLIVAVGSLEVWNTRKYQNPRNRHREPEYKYIAPQEPYPSQEQHRSAQQAYWVRRIKSENKPKWINVYTALVATLAAVGGMGSYFETRHQTKIAKDAYLASTRAWLRVDLDMSTMSVNWSMMDKYLGVQGNIIGINEGMSPALDASLMIRIKDSNAADIPNNGWIKEYCINGKFGVTSAVFPKGRFVLGTGHTMPTNDLEKSFIYLTGSHVEVVICGRYHIAGDQSWHYTGKQFGLLGENRTSLSVGTVVQTGRAISYGSDWGGYAD